MKDRPRFYVEAKGPDVEAVRVGLKWLAEAANRCGGSEAILAIPTKRNLLGSVLTEALGESAAKALNAGRPVSLTTGVALKLVTYRMSLYPQTPTPILCVYTSKAFLDKVDATHNVSEMCVVPWIMDEVRQWVETWAPEELTGKGTEPQARPLDPIVEEALLSLTVVVNVASGLSHPSDRATAIQVFKILYRNQVPFEPEAVRRYLIAECGWQPTDADEVKSIAQGVLVGRRFRRGRPSLRRNIFQQWKKRASEKKRQ